MGHLTTFSGHCRYVVTDIDNTFLNKDKQMLQANLDAIREAQAAGIRVAFATGRCMSAVQLWCDEMGLTAPQVVDNGATVFSPVTKSILAAQTLTVEACRFWMEGFRDAGFPPVLCTPEDYYVANANDDTRHQLDIHGEHYTECDSWDALMAAHGARAVKVSGTTACHVAEIEAAATALTAEGQRRGIPFNATYTEKGILVVTAANVSKLSGVKLAASKLGYAMEDVAAIGDGDNDADMLSGCGLGFALANATPAAKAAASHVVGNCDEAGFAQAIRLIVERNNGIGN